MVTTTNIDINNQNVRIVSYRSLKLPRPSCAAITQCTEASVLFQTPAFYRLDASPFSARNSRASGPAKYLSTSAPLGHFLEFGATK